MVPHTPESEERPDTSSYPFDKWRENVAKRLKKQQHEMFLAHLSNFQESLLNSFFDIAEEIRDNRPVDQRI